MTIGPLTLALLTALTSVIATSIAPFERLMRTQKKEVVPLYMGFGTEMTRGDVILLVKNPTLKYAALTGACLYITWGNPKRYGVAAQLVTEHGDPLVLPPGGTFKQDFGFQKTHFNLVAGTGRSDIDLLMTSIEYIKPLRDTAECHLLVHEITSAGVDEDIEVPVKNCPSLPAAMAREVTLLEQEAHQSPSPFMEVKRQDVPTICPVKLGPVAKDAALL